ncbi:MAG TPA: uroporphyrinogen-III synthase [Candidatus Angelobacter sp.]|nr:uroporphyrinogen-III synthase [Candidatus Angelobacter sp.]
MAETRANSLAGRRIVITRAMTDSEDLARQLSERGAIPVVFPLISFAAPEDFGPLDKAIDEIAQFDWTILTSVRAVRAVADRAKGSGRSLRPAGSHWRAACVGPITAEAARLAGFPVAHVAETHNGVALAEELGSQLAGARVFLPRSDRANPDLPAALRRFGAEVTEVIAYRTVKPAEVDCKTSEEIKFEESHAVLFFSPSAVKFSAQLFAMRWSELQDKVAITAVGPVTAKALRDAGFTRIVVAENTSATSVIEALEKYFAGVEKTAPAGAKSR